MIKRRVVPPILALARIRVAFLPLLPALHPGTSVDWRGIGAGVRLGDAPVFIRRPYRRKADGPIRFGLG